MKGRGGAREMGLRVKWGGFGRKGPLAKTTFCGGREQRRRGKPYLDTYTTRQWKGGTSCKELVLGGGRSSRKPRKNHPSLIWSSTKEK